MARISTVLASWGEAAKYLGWAGGAITFLLGLWTAIRKYRADELVKARAALRDCDAEIVALKREAIIRIDAERAYQDEINRLQQIVIQRRTAQELSDEEPHHPKGSEGTDRR